MLLNDKRSPHHFISGTWTYPTSGYNENKPDREGREQWSDPTNFLPHSTSVRVHKRQKRNACHKPSRSQ